VNPDFIRPYRPEAGVFPGMGIISGTRRIPVTSSEPSSRYVQCKGSSIWHLAVAEEGTFGLLIDTGAKGSLAGEIWFKKYYAGVLKPNHV